MSISLKDIAALGESLFGIPSANATFYGDKSMNADIENLQLARFLETAGVDRDKIWQDTGWGKDESGQWFYEKSDKDVWYDQNNDQDMLSAVSNHHFLEEEPYSPVQVSRKDLPDNVLGRFRKNLGVGDLQVSGNLEGEDARSTLLHEMQHAADTEQGGYDYSTAPGDVPDSEKESLMSMMYPSQLKEVRARNVSNRKDMTDQERSETPPWYTRDVDNVTAPGRQFSLLDVINRTADIDKDVYEKQMNLFNSIPELIRRQ